MVEGLDPSTLLDEVVHVISCGYEDKTEWGKEVSSNSFSPEFSTLDYQGIQLCSQLFILIRLGWIMAVSPRRSWLASRCTAMVGGQFTACPKGQHSRVPLQSTFLTVFSKFCNGLLDLLRSFWASTALFGTAMEAAWSRWNDSPTLTWLSKLWQHFLWLFTVPCLQAIFSLGSS